MEAKILQEIMIPRFVEVLLAIVETPGVPRSFIYANVNGSNPTLKSRIDELRDLGLIDINRMNKRPFAEILTPTDKGKRVVDLLQNLEQVLEE